jgi:putative ABC transport system permease protein
MTIAPILAGSGVERRWRFIMEKLPIWQTGFMASIARKNLFEDIPRFLVAQAGIMFAVSLVTIQTGILNGFTRSTGLLIEQSSADLWVASKQMTFLEVTKPLPLDHLVQARKVTGVERAEALSIRTTLWEDTTGSITPIRVYGFDPNGELFANWKVPEGDLSDLKAPYNIAIDRSQLSSLGVQKIGDQVKIGTLPAKLIGWTENTQAMTSSAYIYTSLENANAYGTSGLDSEVNCQVKGNDIQCLNNVGQSTTAVASNPAPPRKLSLSDLITYVLVRVQPGQDIQALRRNLEATLPGTKVFTKAEILDITRSYWQRRTGVGFILGLGAAVGFIVGIVVVSQILYSSVSDHIREYGTLKAMGASDWVIYRLIVEQALWMAVLGYIPSIGLCLALGTWTMAAKGIVILITPATAASVFGITVVMCVGSALFAVQKVTHVDPAIVFKA